MNHDMLTRQAEKQAAAIARLREVIVQLLAIVDELASTTQVMLLMAEASKPDEVLPGGEGQP